MGVKLQLYKMLLFANRFVCVCALFFATLLLSMKIGREMRRCFGRYFFGLFVCSLVFTCFVLIIKCCCSVLFVCLFTYETIEKQEAIDQFQLINKIYISTGRTNCNTFQEKKSIIHETIHTHTHTHLLCNS